jgi:hypothetical protein
MRSASLLVNGETQGPSTQLALARVLSLGMTSQFFLNLLSQSSFFLNLPSFSIFLLSQSSLNRIVWG